MATIYGIAPNTVILDNVEKIVRGKLMKFHIRGTVQYYQRWSAADKAARLLLLKNSVSEEEFNKREIVRKRVRKANAAIKVNNCLTATAKFVKRWDGIISVENKKRLREDLNAQLNEKLKEGKFETIGQAIGFVKKHK